MLHEISMYSARQIYEENCPSQKNNRTYQELKEEFEELWFCGNQLPIAISGFVNVRLEVRKVTVIW